MAVLLSNKKALELLELKPIVGHEKHSANDIFGNMEGATASIGRYIMKKGAVAEMFVNFDEFLYIVKGSVKIEAEGKATVAREGDIVHIQKETEGKMKVTSNEDEGCEFIILCMPSLKTLGYQ